jgi:hypothetical protein
VDGAALSDAAKLALDSPVVTQAVALSRWIAESGPRPLTPRPLTPRPVLRKPDIPVAAAVIGVAPPENPPTAADVPALNRPWNLSLAMGLLRADGGTVTAGPAVATWPVGAEYPVALCDLGIFVDQAAEPVPPQDPDILAHSGLRLTPSGRALAQRPVRAMNIIVLDVLTQDQPQVPLAGDQHPVQALTAGAGNPAFGDRVAPHRQLHPVRMIGTAASV